MACIGANQWVNEKSSYAGGFVPICENGTAVVQARIGPVVKVAGK